MNEREELQALRRLAELEAKAGGGIVAKATGALAPLGDVGNNPTTGMSFPSLVAAGAGKRMADIGRGAMQMAARGPLQQKMQAGIDEAGRLDAPLMKTGGGQVGGALTDVALTAPAFRLAPQALGGMAGSSVLGGALGALSPVSTGGPDRGENIAMNAGAGFAGNVAMRAGGRLLNPQTSGYVTDLMRRGVTPTPGQILGGVAKRVEGAMSSIPGVGDAIRLGQRRSIEDFNLAVMDDVLSPLGQKIARPTPPGHELIAQTGETISKAYDQLLPTMSGSVDKLLVNDLRRVAGMGMTLPKERAAQLEAIIKNDVLDKFQGGAITGDTAKEIQAKLWSEANSYRRSPDPDQRKLGRAISELRESFTAMLARANPAKAPELAKIDDAYARLLRVETAAQKAANSEGVFTPAQLMSAVKQRDTSLGKRATARGVARTQKLAREGQTVLGGMPPDSGTPLRLMTALGLGGGAYAIDPSMLAAGGTVAAAYGTRPGMRAMAGLLASRPDMMRAAGRGVSAASPYGGLLGAALYDPESLR